MESLIIYLGLGSQRNRGEKDQKKFDEIAYNPGLHGPQTSNLFFPLTIRDNNRQNLNKVYKLIR